MYFSRKEPRKVLKETDISCSESSFYKIHGNKRDRYKIRRLHSVAVVNNKLLINVISFRTSNKTSWCITQYRRTEINDTNGTAGVKQTCTWCIYMLRRLQNKINWGYVTFRTIQVVWVQRSALCPRLRLHLSFNVRTKKRAASTHLLRFLILLLAWWTPLVMKSVYLCVWECKHVVALWNVSPSGFCLNRVAFMK